METPAAALTRAPPLTWHPGRPGGRWAEAIGSRSTGLGGRRILAGTARLTVQKGKNQPEPLIVADTATARALRGIQPDGADPAAPVFGLAGETLANRVSAAARAAGLGEDFFGHSGRIGMARRMVAAGGADRGGPAPRPVEARGHGRPLHPGRGRRRGAEVADLRKPGFVSIIPASPAQAFPNYPVILSC